MGLPVIKQPLGSGSEDLCLVKSTYQHLGVARTSAFSYSSCSAGHSLMLAHQQSDSISQCGLSGNVLLRDSSGSLKIPLSSSHSLPTFYPVHFRCSECLDRCCLLQQQVISRVGSQSRDILLSDGSVWNSGGRSLCFLSVSPFPTVPSPLSSDLGNRNRCIHIHLEPVEVSLTSSLHQSPRPSYKCVLIFPPLPGRFCSSHPNGRHNCGVMNYCGGVPPYFHAGSLMCHRRNYMIGDILASSNVDFFTSVLSRSFSPRVIHDLIKDHRSFPTWQY